jgi:siderophore synthetase component
METTILKTTELLEEAVAVNYTALLNCYCREFSNWSRYMGIPKYDQPVAAHFKGSGYDKHLRIDFSSIGLEVYIPLKYFSETGRHLFHFPIVQRDLKTDEIKAVSPHDFVGLTVSYGKAQYPGIDAAITQTRLQNSIDNLETYLNHFLENEGLVNETEMSFIKAEQSLLLGHIVHPLPKSKLGFNDADLLKYSPETAGRFKLHYFLIHSENILEKTADEILPSVVLKAELLKLVSGDAVVLGLLQQYPEFTVVPMHPWEALYLLQQEEVQQMQVENRLFSLGQWANYLPRLLLFVRYITRIATGCLSSLCM